MLRLIEFNRQSSSHAFYISIYMFRQEESFDGDLSV